MNVKKYAVNYSEKQARWTCTCPDFRFRKSKVRPNPRKPVDEFTCKHIRSILDWASVNAKDERYKPRVLFEPIADTLREMGKEFKRFEIAGSYRRQKAHLKDLDVVVLLSGDDDLKKLQEMISLVGAIKSGKEQRITAEIENVQVDFRIIYAQSSWFTALLHFTGSKEENIRLRRKAIELGMKLNEFELRSRDGRMLPVWSERDVYSYLDEEYKEPWEREVDDNAEGRW